MCLNLFILSEMVQICPKLVKFDLKKTKKTVKIGLNLSKFFYCIGKCLNPFYFKFTN